ncbi:MAG TPA: hypothetical protein VM536_14720, partial [Chloroflexia bacterium]|nr:hypothetical protein [Chloroflexia bacterium]
ATVANMAPADAVKTLNILYQLRGHLLVAQELFVGGQRDQAVEQATIPAKDLFDAVASSLQAQGQDQKVRAALDHYVVALGQGGPEATAGHQAALQAVDGAIVTLAGPSGPGDPALRGPLLQALVTKAGAEYAEGVKDGKVTEDEPYQSAYGILLAALSLSPQASPAAPLLADPASVLHGIETLRGVTGTPEADTETPAENIAAARDDVRGALELYKAGQADAAYEQAASVYLDRFEKLEVALGKLDNNIVPTLETDFKALRDGIKAGQPAAELEVIAARLDSGLVRAGQLLAR